MEKMWMSVAGANFGLFKPNSKSANTRVLCWLASRFVVLVPPFHETVPFGKVWVSRIRGGGKRSESSFSCFFGFLDEIRFSRMSFFRKCRSCHSQNRARMTCQSFPVLFSIFLALLAFLTANRYLAWMILASSSCSLRRSSSVVLVSSSSGATSLMLRELSFFMSAPDTTGCLYATGLTIVSQ